MRMMVCVDKRLGMMFNGRRQSIDRVVVADMVKEAVAAGSVIWMSAYSAGLFEEGDPVRVQEDFLKMARNDEYCFVEDADISEVLIQVIKQVIVYRWNRAYPFDKEFSVDLNGPKWTLVRSEELVGHSHSVITKEVYDRILPTETVR